MAAELWTSIGTDLVAASSVVGVLCHLATIVPYAPITRTIRPSRWSSGAECLLEAATRTAGHNPALRARMQRTARDMVARQHLDATDDLADALNL